MTFVYPTHVQASRASRQRAAQGIIYLRPEISRAPGGASSATAARATPAWRLRAVRLKQVRVGVRFAHQDSRRNRANYGVGLLNVTGLVEGLYILHHGKLTAVGGRFLYARHLENVVFDLGVLPLRP